MRSKIIVTDDNSKTLLIPELNETYHSTKGAITEAKHVFIKEGLHFSGQSSLKIFEMGFGTGLNAIITVNESEKNNLDILYHTIEWIPVDEHIIKEMDYLNALNISHLKDAYYYMHQSKHNEELSLSDHFIFKKFINKIEEHELELAFYDIIYYDAFGPKVQPELWDIPVLTQMYNALKTGGIFVTYCAQGQFKRNLKEIGFRVESIPGPPGKREMTRAFK